MSDGANFKVCMLGAQGVGKTALVERFLHPTAQFSTAHPPTIGAAFTTKTMQPAGAPQPIVMGIWDTAGEERFESMMKIYYRKAYVAIVCYDITNASSWDRVSYWVNEIRDVEGDCKIILVGTKLDMLKENQRAVPKEVVSQLATSIGGADIFETSAKTGHMILELFEKIAHDYVADNKHIMANSSMLDKKPAGSSRRGACC